MRHRTLLIVAVAVLLAGGVGYLAGRSGPGPLAERTEDAAGPVDREDAPDSGAPGATPGGIAHAQADVPLPDVGTPLLEIHDTLVRRAAAGDAPAACRLAAEHESCERDRLRLRSVDAQGQRQARVMASQAGLVDDMRTRIESQRLQLGRQRVALERTLARCEAAPTLSPAQRARYWRQAALAGHVPSMRHYASGSAFRLHDLMEALPALQTYRLEAEAIALRAARAGDAASMYELALAYANVDNGRRRSFLAQSVTPELSSALAWFSVLARHPAIVALPPGHPVSDDIARQLQGLQAAATAAETAAAERLAAGVRTDGANLRDAAQLVPGGGVRDTTAEACGDTPAGKRALR